MISTIINMPFILWIICISILFSNENHILGYIFAGLAALILIPVVTIEFAIVLALEGLYILKYKAKYFFDL